MLIVPYGRARAEITVVNSRFIASLAPADSVEAARAYIAGIRAEFPDATHNVPAFIIGGGNAVTEFCSDDGEPSGTSGRPLLAALKGSGLGNAVVVVTRYFGGTLLGTGGLVRAYTKAATLSLQSAGILEMRVCSKTEICVSYASYAALEPLLRASGIPFAAEYGEAVTLTCTVPAENAERFAGDVTERTDGSARIRPLGEGLCPLEP